MTDGKDGTLFPKSAGGTNHPEQAGTRPDPTPPPPATVQGANETLPGQTKVTVTHVRNNIALLYKSIGADQGKCRGCGATIWWVMHKSGRKAPYTKDALNHFADCPRRDQYRKQGRIRKDSK